MKNPKTARLHTQIVSLLPTPNSTENPSAVDTQFLTVQDALSKMAITSSMNAVRTGARAALHELPWALYANGGSLARCAELLHETGELEFSGMFYEAAADRASGYARSSYLTYAAAAYGRAGEDGDAEQVIRTFLRTESIDVAVRALDELANESVTKGQLYKALAETLDTFDDAQYAALRDPSSQNYSARLADFSTEGEAASAFWDLAITNTLAGHIERFPAGDRAFVNDLDSLRLNAR